MLLALLSLLFPAAAAPPNIVFVLADDLDLASIDELPELRPLMQDAGMTFTQAHVSVSLCCPSRATILRGQYAHNTGVLSNRPPNGGYEKFRNTGAEASTVATWLQGAGYDTALLGKYLNGYPIDGQRREIPPGWAHWFVPVAGDPYGGFSYRVNRNGRMAWFGRREDDYITDVLAREAVRFLAQEVEAQRPFFLFLAPFAPHSPETPAPRFAELYPDVQAPRTPAFNEEDVSDKPPWVRARPTMSDNLVAQLDARYRRRLQSTRGIVDLLATVLTALQSNGQLEDTWVVFTSDNGYHQGQHRLNAGKNTAYEEDLRVPLIIRGPGVPAGTRNDALVVNTDFAPTFAALANLTPPDWVDGRSLVPLLSGEPVPWRQAFLVEHRGMATVRVPTATVLEPPDAQEGDSDWKGGTPTFAGIHTRDWVYVAYEGGERELYDLQNDPAQLQNLAATADAERVASLHAWLEALRACAGASCRAAEDGPPGEQGPVHH